MDIQHGQVRERDTHTATTREIDINRENSGTVYADSMQQYIWPGSKGTLKPMSREINQLHCVCCGWRVV